MLRIEKRGGNEREIKTHIGKERERERVLPFFKLQRCKLVEVGRRSTKQSAKAPFYVLSLSFSLFLSFFLLLSSIPDVPLQIQLAPVFRVCFLRAH